MLSILIPVFNYDVRQLVGELQWQTQSSGVSYEILVLDDGSDSGFCNINREIANLPNVSYKELSKNIGRSKIRNTLFTQARYEYLLFIDCDAKVNNPRFVSNYLSYCHGEVVVCGGTSYDEILPDKKEYLLRWYYGHKRESRPASLRNQHPAGSFSTFNFLVSKSVLQKVWFEESINSYGYEDTVFCCDLKKHDIEIIHIDNPLVHTGIDSNKVFLNKAFASVRNLYFISQKQDIKKELGREVKLLSYYKTIKMIGLVPMFRFFFKFSKNNIERNLVTKGHNLFYYDMLRLGYLCSLK